MLKRSVDLSSVNHVTLLARPVPELLPTIVNPASQILSLTTRKNVSPTVVLVNSPTPTEFVKTVRKTVCSVPLPLTVWSVTTHMKSITTSVSNLAHLIPSKRLSTLKFSVKTVT